MNGTGVNNPVENRFKYQNKETLALFGLNGINDFGARFLDKTIGRWWGVDPLAEKRYNYSSYNYVSNNPIGRIDLFGLIDVNGDGKDDGTLLPEVTVTAKRNDNSNGSNNWNNFITEFGNEGYNNLKSTYKKAKLVPYNSNFAGAVYGRDGNGQVMIPDDILERIDEEVEDEAISVLATLWASEQSGVDPNSANFMFNPFARANFYNYYISTGISNEEAKGIISTVGISSVLSYVGNVNINPFMKIIKAKGGKIDGFTIGTKRGYGAQQRFDWHTISSKNLSGKWAQGRRLPHYHIGRGNTLRKHKPWE